MGSYSKQNKTKPNKNPFYCCNRKEKPAGWSLRLSLPGWVLHQVIFSILLLLERPLFNVSQFGSIFWIAGWLTQAEEANRKPIEMFIRTLGIQFLTKLWKRLLRASLVAQWLRICLLMQGIRVRALVWEDPTCRGATRPVSHNYLACASGACAPQQERPR